MSARMHICFATSGLPFHGDTLKEKGLGGSETALLCVAREFAKLGHRVSVFCQCDKPGSYDGVDYYQASFFTKVCAVTTFDVLIASRWIEFLSTPSKAGLRILWLHDTIQSKKRLFEHGWQCDNFFLLSDYHIANYLEGEDEEDTDKHKIAEFRPWVWKTNNGVDLEQIERNLQPKVPGKLIYTSRPERGLHFLLSRHCFPKLLKEFPDLKLHYANYALGGMQVPDQVAQCIALSEHLAKQFPNNVINMGHLTKDELYKEMSSAELLLYPTEFPEISCISAMEAQACGTPIVSTNDFALKETVANGRTGHLINGKPSQSEEYFAKFNRKTLSLLRDDKRRAAMAKEGPKWIREQGYTWASVAKNWEARFFSLMEQRWEENSAQIVQELTRNHDLVMARELVSPDTIVAANLDNLVEFAPTNDELTTETIKKTVFDGIKRFDKLSQLMLSAECDPETVWDFASGDSSFAIYFAKASPKTTCYAIDQDMGVLNRLEIYVEKTQEKIEDETFTNRIKFIIGNSLGNEFADLPKPDLLFMGSWVDTLKEPWKAIEEATKIVGPGGYVAFTTRSGPTTATLPEQQHHKRLWNFCQTDFYEMFGREFVGKLSFHEETISPGGDTVGHWLCLLPVGEEEFKAQPLTADRRKRVTRPYQSLVAAMIVRDGEDWMNLCLKQVLPIVDHVVIALDDRTADHTEDVLRWLDPEDRKIEIVRTTFEHFAQFRNASIEGVDSDWILWIDGDEVLTEAPRLRRYLQTSVFEGYSIKQCHLMLDVHGTFDIPVRLLRNRPQYQFVGCIHEHCMDVSAGDFDTSIRPTMLIPDVDLAHYGYLNEKQRRLKCSNRNMKLLQMDIEIYGKKGRKLSWVLAIRDYLNIVKWNAEKKHLNKTGIARGSEEHRMLEAAVSTYFQHFSDHTTKFHRIAFPMYQEALAILGTSGIPIGDRPAPPFSVALGLAAAMGGNANEEVKAKVAWFIDQTEYLEFMDRQHKQMLEQLGVVKPKTYADDLTRPSQVKFEYDDGLPHLLTQGTEAIHEVTGRLK